jgi:hypothetical protein
MLFLAKEKVWPFNWFWVKLLRFAPPLAGQIERKGGEF